VAGFVDGDGMLLVGNQHVGALAPAQDDAVARLVEVLSGEDVTTRPHRADRRLVDQVRQIRAGEAGCPPGHHLQAQARIEELALAVDLQDRQPFPQVGERDRDLPVEAARSEQRGVEDLGPVGGG
jgi:hypothetical protein